MLANSEFLILLNQATTDRDELAALLNISENQLSYITNVGAGKGLIRCSGNLVPFENSFPKNTKLYRLMTTKPGGMLVKKYFCVVLLNVFRQHPFGKEGM